MHFEEGSIFENLAKCCILQLQVQYQTSQLYTERIKILIKILLLVIFHPIIVCLLNNGWFFSVFGISSIRSTSICHCPKQSSKKSFSKNRKLIKKYVQKVCSKSVHVSPLWTQLPPHTFLIFYFSFARHLPTVSPFLIAIL